MKPTRFPQLDQYTRAQLVGAFKLYAGNQKKNDKQAIAYLIGMIDHHAGWVASFCDLKRATILDMLFCRLNETTIFRLIRSDYTADQLAQILKK